MKLLIFSLLCLPITLLAEGGLPSQPYIYVEGKAQITREPDMVTLSFQLGAHDADQVAAGKQVQVQAAKVFVMLDEEKIAQKDVQAENIRWQPEYEEDPESAARAEGRTSKITGYHVTRPFSVIVREIGAFPKLIDQLLVLGVEEFTEMTPGLTNRQEIRKQARAQALADARAQAEEALKNEKKTVGPVFAISPVSVPEIGGRLLGGSGPNADFLYSGSNLTQRKLDPKQYRLAPIEVSEMMHVIYLIE